VPVAWAAPLREQLAVAAHARRVAVPDAARAEQPDASAVAPPHERPEVSMVSATSSERPDA
jgi:hypothetical protein